MPFRVIVGNVAIECDTAEDALAIARQIGDIKPSRTSSPVERTLNGSSRWTASRVAEFFRNIEGKQRKVLDALFDNPDGRTYDQLLTLLSTDKGRVLAGVLSGLWKNAKKVGADPGDLYEKRPTTLGGRQAYEYVLTDNFRKAVEKHRGQ